MSLESNTKEETKPLLDKINAKSIESAKDSDSEPRIAFYVGLDSHVGTHTVKAILSSERFSNSVVLAHSEDVVKLRNEGIKAHDVEIYKDTDELSIFSLRNIECRDPLEHELLKLKRDLCRPPNFNLQPKKVDLDYGNTYPGMSKKKGGHRHQFIRKLK